MGMSMRAAVLTEFGKPMEITEATIDDPGPREVLIKVAASGICGSDIKAIDGHSPVIRELPSILGHESAGVVHSVGADVTAVAPGDKVIVSMSGPCGRCRACSMARFALCSGKSRMATIMGLMADGTTRLRVGGKQTRPMIGIGSFAEYVCVDESRCVKTSSTTPLDLACLVACGVSTGIGAVLNVARVEHGASVLVVGCGGVGLNVIQGAVLAGATTIIAADVVPRKLELASTFGATHTILAGDDLPGQVGAIRRGGVEYAFDVTGNAKVLESTFKATRPGGTTVMVGSPPAGQQISIEPSALFASRRLMGTQGGDCSPGHDLPMIVDFHAAGRINLEDLVSERVKLDDINEAVTRVRAGDVARAVVVFG